MSTTPFPLPIMLDAADRKALRARAHHLDPVIMIGEAGLTRAVLDETDRALRTHELIKVRVLGDDREQRQAMSTEICSALGCTAVQSIGKLLVLYRPRPIEDHRDEPHVPKKRAAQGLGRAKKSSANARKATKRAADGDAVRGGGPTRGSGSARGGGSARRSATTPGSATAARPVAKRAGRTTGATKTAGAAAKQGRRSPERTDVRAAGRPGPRPTGRTSARSARSTSTRQAGRTKKG